MRWIAFLLLATAAVAEDSAECGAECGGDGDAAAGPSLLQQVRSGNKMVSEQQLLEREEQRREKVVDGIVERRLIILASLIREKVPSADAIALIRSLAEHFHVERAEDLKSDSSLNALIQESAAPLQTILCHLRKTDDCSREWRMYLEDALNVLSELGFNLLQLIRGKPSTTKTHSLAEQGTVDSQLLNLLQDHLFKHLKVIVKSGESAESTVVFASDAMTRLKAMDESSMLAFQEYNTAQLAKKYFLSVLHTACLPSTGSCADRLANEIWATDQILMGEGDTGTMLLQAGLRPAIKVVMKLFGLPELPEETAAERAMAVEAYLKQRGLSRM